MPLPVVVYEDSEWEKFRPDAEERATFEISSGERSLLDRVCGLVDEAWEKVEKRRVKVGPNAALAVWCRPELAERVAVRTGLQVNSPLAGETLLLNGRGLWSAFPDCEECEGAWVGVARGQVACIYAARPVWPKLSPTIAQSRERLGRVLEGLPHREVGNWVRMADSPSDL